MRISNNSNISAIMHIKQPYYHTSASLSTKLHGHVYVHAECIFYFWYSNGFLIRSMTLKCLDVRFLTAYILLLHIDNITINHAKPLKHISPPLSSNNNNKQNVLASSRLLHYMYVCNLHRMPYMRPQWKWNCIKSLWGNGWSVFHKTKRHHRVKK